MENGVPSAGVISQVASSESAAHGGFLNELVVSANAVAKGASVTRALNTETCPCGSWGRGQRPGQRETSGPMAVTSSTDSGLPDTTSEPTAERPTVSCVAP